MKRLFKVAGFISYFSALTATPLCASQKVEDPKPSVDFPSKFHPLSKEKGTVSMTQQDFTIDGGVHTVDEPILRQKGVPITDFSPKLKQLFEQMHRIMKEHGGIGIAAEQVGIAYRCCVVDVAECFPEADGKKASEPKILCRLDGVDCNPKELMPLYFCNPEIVATEGSCDFREGCLSVKDFYAEVTRPQKITAKYQDCEGQWHTLECDGILARCMQHEFDHLDGIVFVDRLSPKDTKKWQRFYAKLEYEQQFLQNFLKEEHQRRGLLFFSTEDIEGPNVEEMISRIKPKIGLTSESIAPLSAVNSEFLDPRFWESEQLKIKDSEITDESNQDQ